MTMIDTTSIMLATSMLYDSVSDKFPSLHKQGITKPTMFDISDCITVCEIKDNGTVKFDKIYYTKYDTVRLRRNDEKILLTKMLDHHTFEYIVVGVDEAELGPVVCDTVYVANYTPISDEIVQKLYDDWILKQ